MSCFQRAGALALALSLFLPPVATLAREPGPQYVIISFDGALHIDQWKRSRALARETGARFTYFLSCVYLLSSETRSAYRGPGMAPGRTNIGSGLSRRNVAERLRQIWAARREGHEIASHGCGHFDGKNWDAAAWKEEFAQFGAVLRDAWALNDIPFEPAGWAAFAENGIAGFRAPYLSARPPLYAALGEDGFAYDASTVSRRPERPRQENGLTRFALPLIPEGPEDRRVIAMDYNLYVRHSNGVEQPENGRAFEARAYEAFRTAFEEQYSGERIPLQLGFHFTLMNGGAYWRALERFAGEVCARNEVRCVGYRDYLDATAPDRTDG